MPMLIELLKDADPIRHEAPLRDAHRQAMRRAIGRAAVADLAMPPMRGRVRLVAAMAATVAGLALVGYEAWEHGTPLAAAVRFEVRLAEQSPFPGAIVARVANSDRLLYLHPEMVVGNDDVASTSVSPSGDRFDVAVYLVPSAAERMRQATAAHIGRPVAIVIDGEVVMAPTLRSAISDVALMTGDYSRAEAERLAKGIR